jgi:hypothetical protein
MVKLLCSKASHSDVVCMPEVENKAFCFNISEDREADGSAVQSVLLTMPVGQTQKQKALVATVYILCSLMP